MANANGRWIAVAIAIACSGCSGAQPAKGAAPNILLVTIDTWRADRLSARVAPNLDRPAASGIRFTAARTAAPLTLPSHTTILTGLLPPAHGVRENGVDVLSDAHPTIATLLRHAGYRTAAFVGAYVLDRRFGLSAGFETYDDRIARDRAAADRLEAERPASAVVDAALDWFAVQDQGRTEDQGRTKHQAPGPKDLSSYGFTSTIPTLRTPRHRSSAAGPAPPMRMRSPTRTPRLHGCLSGFAATASRTGR